MEIFGVPLPSSITSELYVNRVVKLYMDDGGAPKFAIRLRDGSYWGQKWIEGYQFPVRAYPTWDTELRARKKLEKLTDNGEIE